MLLIYEGTITDRMCWYLKDGNQSLSANTMETWDLINCVTVDCLAVSCESVQGIDN